MGTSSASTIATLVSRRIRFVRSSDRFDMVISLLVRIPGISQPDNGYVTSAAPTMHNDKSFSGPMSYL
jgi:hypothetical protein